MSGKDAERRNRSKHGGVGKQKKKKGPGGLQGAQLWGEEREEFDEYCCLASVGELVPPR